MEQRREAVRSDCVANVLHWCQGPLRFIEREIIPAIQLTSVALLSIIPLYNSAS